MQDSPYLQEQLDCWVSPIIWAMGKNAKGGHSLRKGVRTNTILPAGLQILLSRRIWSSSSKNGGGRLLPGF